jgi:hypothetical protein
VQFQVAVGYGSVRNEPEAQDIIDADAQNAEVIDSEIIDEQQGKTGARSHGRQK